MTKEQLILEVNNKQKQITDLYALVDTLQTNMNAAIFYLNEEYKQKVTSVPSYKWCMNWKQGDERN